MLGVRDWLQFVWVCCRITKNQEVKKAALDALKELPKGSELRDPVLFLLLLCGGDVDVRLLRDLIDHPNPYIRTLANLEAARTKLVADPTDGIIAECRVQLDKEEVLTGDLLSIARSGQVSYEKAFLDTVRLYLLMQQVKELSHEDIGAWAMQPYGPEEGISVAVLAHLVFASWFSLPPSAGKRTPAPVNPDTTFDEVLADRFVRLRDESPNPWKEARAVHALFN